MSEGRSKRLSSMTGYGRGRHENRLAAAQVELRSVNGKGLFLKLRVPGDRLDLEPRLEAILRGKLERGNVQGLVRVRLLEARGAELDLGVLARYAKQWKRAEKDLGLQRQEPKLAEMLTLPGALETPPEEERVTSAVQQAVLAACREALDALLEARAKEGEALRKELLRLCRRLGEELERCEKRLPQAKKASEKRFQERVQSAWDAAKVAEPIDLTRELVVLAEKADVREELARLAIHLNRLQKLLQKGGPCGRELEFLSQECHREVTTLGNKSADTRMSQLVVKMKVLVQQLKEQIANVE